MGLYTREAGAWVEGAMMQRDAQWSDPGSNGYVNDEGSWVQFQPGEQDAAFPPPNNLQASPSSTAVTLTWNDVSLGGPDPTHVQVRIPEVTAVWTEYSWGTVTAGYAALTPSTEYQAQVRYVIRSTEDGSVTRTSSITTLFFSTSAASAPSFPAQDPGGTGPDSIVTFPPLGPGPGGGGDTCTWEYIVQYPDVAVQPLLVWLDSATTATGVASEAEVEIDFIDEGFTCGQLVRWKFREQCSISGNGDWEYSDAFLVPCDWTDPCGGALDTPAFDQNPWDDAILALFKFCVNDTQGQTIEDSIGGREFGKLEAYLAPFHDGLRYNVFSKSSIPVKGAPLTAGKNTALGDITSGSDLTVTIGVNLSEQPPNALAGGARLLVIGNKITITVIGSGAGYTAIAYIPGDGTAVLIGTTEMTLDEDHQITLTVDYDGNKVLYVDGIADQTDTDADVPQFDSFTNDLVVYATPSSTTSLVGAWDYVVPAHEVPLIAGVPAQFTGGTVTDLDGYRYHTFTSSSDLICTVAGTLEGVHIGGGGGGCVGGGGAGEVLPIDIGITVGTYPIVIGAAGAGRQSRLPAAHGGNGGNTAGFGLTAIGGGGGSGPASNPPAGASGGGANSTYGNGVAGVGTAGFNGGLANSDRSGGGGGAGAVGANGTGTVGGAGGAGTPWPAGGTTWAGGGGGCSTVTDVGAGAGGTGGGGAGGGLNVNGVAATPNTGSGGGGSGVGNASRTGGAGATGRTIIRYPYTP